ncbi:hypothetical protein [Rhodopseudomonas palustris]|uniref:hypothetical protein n=1 Tax=Rhodopseudomonas palustris TaxID=1076 RepID=UPI0021F26DDD|nr:hypothetical protein [Rhodopseudomonas palustris]
MNALVRAEIYASANKKEVAKLLSKDGAGYLPLPAEVIERAMTYYDDKAYGETNAITHPEWKLGRIDFQPWPYPSATRLIVEAMNDTVVAGDTTFLKKLDPDFVTKDLVDYAFVKQAMTKHPDWKNSPSVDPADPFTRTEVLAL